MVSMLSNKMHINVFSSQKAPRNSAKIKVYIYIYIKDTNLYFGFIFVSHNRITKNNRITLITYIFEPHQGK
jgi:hypothetical protein